MSGDFSFLKGNIETIILCSLYNGNKYGYEIAKEIKERTSDRYEIKQPTLYSYLKRLEEDDLIVSYWGENSNGGRRRYYALTKAGRENCEQFISEWQYHREVLNDLVDGTANGAEISQEKVTPLFGRRSKKRSRQNELQEELEEQDEISRRLRQLAATDVEDKPEQEPVEEEQEQVEEPKVIERVVYVERPAETQPEPEPEPVVEQTAATEDARARFEVNQDNAEDFMHDFEERAREVSERQPAEGENYQHVLNNIIGDQLDSITSSGTETATTSYYDERHAALEDVADSLAKEGIRMRIYNHATATYKSKMLIPQAKVLCQAAWLTYIVALIYFGVFALSSIAAHVWQPFVIALAVLMLIPLGFTIYAIVDPTRKNKRAFNFRLSMIVASVVCVIIALGAVGISALSNVEFANYAQTSKCIFIPLGIAILIPLYIAFYDVLYKQY